MAPTLTSRMTPVTTISDDTSTTTTTNGPPSPTDADETTSMISTTQKEMPPATKMITTETLNENINQSPTKKIQSTTTDLFPSDKTHYADLDLKSLMIIIITLSATSLLLSLVAIMISIICSCRKGTKKWKPRKELPKMNYTYTSPIYNPYFSKEKEDM